MGTARKQFASRLRESMRARGHFAPRGGGSGVDVAALARTANVSYEMARRYAKGVNIPDIERLERIAKWLRVDVSWLRDGMGEADQRSNISAVPPRFSARVPILEWDVLQEDDLKRAIEVAASDKWLHVESRVSEMSIALHVEGDSMMCEGGGFPPGTLIVVDLLGEAFNGDYVIARLGSGEPAMFRQLIVDGAISYLRAMNRDYPMEKLGGGRILGVVVESYKRDTFPRRTLAALAA